MNENVDWNFSQIEAISNSVTRNTEIKTLYTILRNVNSNDFVLRISVCISTLRNYIDSKIDKFVFIQGVSVKVLIYY